MPEGQGLVLSVRPPARPGTAHDDARWPRPHMRCSGSARPLEECGHLSLARSTSPHTSSRAPRARAGVPHSTTHGGDDKGMAVGPKERVTASDGGLRAGAAAPLICRPGAAIVEHSPRRPSTRSSGGLAIASRAFRGAPETD